MILGLECSFSSRKSGLSSLLFASALKPFYLGAGRSVCQHRMASASGELLFKHSAPNHAVLRSLLPAHIARHFQDQLHASHNP